MDGHFHHEERVEPKWIVEGLLPQGYLCLLAGRPKDGKTCFTVALAYAVSQGIPFVGMKTTKSTVLYFMCEESPEEFDLAICPHLPEGTVEDLGVAFARISVDNPFDLSALRMRLIAINPGLVAIDPLLDATASRNVVLNHRKHPKGRLITLDLSGRGLFADRTSASSAPPPATSVPSPTAPDAPRPNETKNRHLSGKGT